MERYRDEINALVTMQPPTLNRRTDAFGFSRAWGFETWHPQAAYSPIHAGVDFSAEPNEHIQAPCDCMAWGWFVDGSVGAYTMIIPKISGSPSEEIALYLFHCEPTGRRWADFLRSERITKHAGYGIGAPHLHLECAVTPDLACALHAAGLLDLHRITKGHWMDKAREAEFSQSQAYQRVQKQKREWGISLVFNDAIVRGALPPYRRSRHSRIGKGETWIIDLPAIWRNA